VFDRQSTAELLQLFVHGPRISPEIERDFDGYCDDLMARMVPRLLLFLVVVLVVWWPTDLLIYRGQPREQVLLGLARGAIVAQHIFWLTLGRDLVRRRPAAVGTFVAISETWLVGVLAGAGGQLDSPWAYYLYIWPLVSVALLRPLWTRFVRVQVVALGSLACFVVVSGTPLDHPYLASTVSFMIFCAFFCVLVGHGVWLLLRENFVKQRFIEAQRRQLDGFNQQLEQRVAEQTRDLRVLSQRLETLRENERAWMAREMHDALGQELTAVRYALDLVRTRLSGQDRRIDGALADVQDRVAMAHGSVRRILQRLRPRVLDDLGLPAALAWLARDAIESAGLAATVESRPPDLRLDADRETALYRVAQEAVSNALRHARARSVVVELQVHDAVCRMIITDEGIGMQSAGAGSGHDGVGCIGIRERIAALGGTTRWQTPPDGGTRVHIELPLEAPC